MATVLTNTGRAKITGRIKGSDANEPVYCGWGTGTGFTANVTNTSLSAECLLNLGATGTSDHTSGTSTLVCTSVASDSYQVVATRTCATTSGTVTNAGLWDAGSAGNLFLVGDFTGIALAIGDSIQFTFKLQFT